MFMLYIVQLLLLLSFATCFWAGMIYTKIHTMYHIWLYFMYNHTLFIYCLISAVYMFVWLIYNIPVAHAGGKELLYSHVLAYNRLNLQLQGLSLHYPHEANQYLWTLDWLSGRRTENKYWNDCWLVPLSSSELTGGRADCLLVKEATQSVCTIQFKYMWEYSTDTLDKLSIEYKGLSDVLFITAVDQELVTWIAEYFVTKKPSINIVLTVHQENITHAPWEQTVAQHFEWLNFNQKSVDKLYHKNPEQAHTMFTQEATSFADIVTQKLAQTHWFIQGGEE